MSDVNVKQIKEIAEKSEIIGTTCYNEFWLFERIHFNKYRVNILSSYTI